MRIRKGITMKAKRSIRYISGRIWWIGMAVLLLLLLLTATQAMLFMRGQTPVWSVLLMGFALAAYLSAAVFWISKPYVSYTSRAQIQ